ncbi:PP2C family protein-serine/threonine phosphatase [Mycolicibacterium sp.]|uniref:PP2C family protein-serine/threonine phosphatase n=1 Tax=Mycolicibacterium sp. TaxID=2320850 RepID=UPI0025F567DE|nr:PP2C family protein-serine/threonine phosphatase [Mycolicibacterium sp.]
MNGLVRVSSRYVPSRELGGDCFDHTWVDDEHLVVYLIDVSGHGIAPALLSVSVHNLLRSGTIPLATLLSPERVLAELNAKFQMDQHGENYFTMWYGVYESSTRTLRYASAGHPPALALTVEDGAVTTTKLATQSMPLGMFSDTEFTCDDYIVPPDGQLVLYSDGAFELPMPEGNASLDAFIGLCAEFAATPDWTVDELISTLQSLTTGGLFADDCSLIQLRFH